MTSSGEESVSEGSFTSSSEGSNEDNPNEELKTTMTFEDKSDSGMEVICQRASDNASKQKKYLGAIDESNQATGTRPKSTRQVVCAEIHNADIKSGSFLPAQLTEDETLELSSAVANVTGAGMRKHGHCQHQNIVINNPKLYVTKKTELSAPRARNVNLGGTQNIQSTRQDVDAPSSEENNTRQQPRVPKDPRLKRIKDKTESDIIKWTCGMIKTSSVDKIAKLIDKGDMWITITGNAGDGKTTTGYMVLEEMVKRGKEVFHVKEPDQYHIVTENTKKSVIMFNDVFGAFSFDPTALSKWESVIHDALDNIELYREHERSVQVTVLFISRWNVLQGARNMLGKFEDDILGQKVIVNLGEERDENMKSERMDILEHHLQTNSVIDVKTDEKKHVVSCKPPHGFPFCCKMFAQLKKKRKEMKIKDFFSCPIQFLNRTTKVLVEDIQTEKLFKLLLERNGKLAIFSKENEEIRRQIYPALSSLIGSYLEENKGIITFSHPSIYESAAYCICKKDVVFAIDKLSFSFLLQNVKFQDQTSAEGGDHDSMFIYVPTTEANIERICQRFCHQVLDKKFDFLKHRFFQNRELCEKLISATILKTKHTYYRLLCFQGTTDKKIHIDEKDVGGDTLLQVAVRCGNLTAVRVVLAHGAGVDELSNNEGCKETALQMVFKSTVINTDILKILIDHGADVNRADENGQTLLHKYQNFPIEYEIILTSQDADVNIADCKGITPLHQVCQSGETDKHTLGIMIQRGAEVNKPDTKGKTPFHYICQNEKASGSIVQLMIVCGANVEKADKDGKTALHYLCHYRDPDINTLDQMIRKGADINKPDKDATTPLHQLCQNKRSKKETIDFMIDNGGNLNQANKDGVTPLYYLQSSGNSFVDVLSQSSSDITKIDQNGMTPLHHLCLLPAQYEKLGEMVSHCTDVNKADKGGKIPLHYLCKYGMADEYTLSVMLKHGADVNKTDKDGQTPINYLCQYGRADESTLDLMIRHGAEVNKSDQEGQTVLHYICRYRPDQSSIYLLIQHFADVNKQDNHGMTPLHYLCQYWKTFENTIYLLTQHRADVNIADRHGMTPLDYLKLDDRAIERIRRLLLQKDTDLNHADKKEYKGLHLLCRHVEVDESTVYLMLQLGFDANQTDKYESTPLHYLCQEWSKNEFSIYMMLRYAADVNKADKHGLTPLHYICKHWTEGKDINTGHLTHTTHFRPLPSSCEKLKDNEFLLYTMLKRGGDVSKLDRAGFTPIDYLCQNRKANKTAIFSILDMFVDVDNADDLGVITAHYLRQNGRKNQSFMEKTVEEGNDVRSTEIDGFTALHYLCQNEDVTESSLLKMLEKDSDADTGYINVMPLQKDEVCAANKANSDWLTPLHYLCQNEKVTEGLISIMLEKGGDPNIADNYGCNPLHYLCQNREAKIGILHMLLQRGCDANKVDTNGLTPLDYLFPK